MTAHGIEENTQDMGKANLSLIDDIRQEMVINNEQNAKIIEQNNKIIALLEEMNSLLKK